MRLALLIAWVLCLAAAGNVAVAQPADLTAWLERERAAGASLPDLSGYRFRYRVELVEMPAPGELESLRQAVAKYPDHPDRQRLATLERRARAGPDVTRHTLWLLGPGRWRFNENVEYSERGWYDTVVTPRHAWRLLSDQLTLIDPRDGYPQGYDYAALEHYFKRDLSLMLFGGIGRGRSPDWQLTVSALDARSRWTHTESSETTAFEYEGDWDAQAGRGFVRRMELLRSSFRPDLQGQRWVFQDWQADPVSGLWVASRVDEYSPTGVLERVLIFEGTSPQPQREVDALLAVPALDKPDPIRGPLTVEQIFDFRPGRKEISDVTPDGLVPVAPLEHEGVTSFPWQRVAWGLGLAAVVVLIVARIWQRARSRT